MDLPSTSGGQPRAIAMAYNVSGVSWTAKTNNLKNVFMPCVLVFVRQSLALRGSTASPAKKFSFKLLIYTPNYIYYKFLGRHCMILDEKSNQQSHTSANHVAKNNAWPGKYTGAIVTQTLWE